MALPAGWDIRQVKGTRMDLLGNPGAGKLVFTPNVPHIGEKNSKAIIYRKSIDVPLQPDGTFLVPLPVSINDPDIAPHFKYDVLEQIIGSPDYKYQIVVDVSLPAGEPFDIYDLMVLGTVPAGSTGLTREMADLLYLPREEVPNVDGFVTDAELIASETDSRNRTFHTGTQDPSTIANLLEYIQDSVAAMFAWNNATATYNDTTGTITVTVPPGNTTDPELIRDTIGVAMVGVGNITVTINDAADTITIATTATVNRTDAATDVLIAERALDTTVVHLAGAETVTGIKTFTAPPVVPTDSFAKEKVAGLTPVYNRTAGSRPTIFADSSTTFPNLATWLAANAPGYAGAVVWDSADYGSSHPGPGGQQRVGDRWKKMRA